MNISFCSNLDSSLHNSPIISGQGSPVQMSKPAKSTVQTPRSPVPHPPSQTPRQSSRSRAQTPKATFTQKSLRTPRRSQTFHENIERPVSRAIGNTWIFFIFFSEFFFFLYHVVTKAGHISRYEAILFDSCSI